MYLLKVYSVFSVHQDETQIQKKNLSDKITGTKNALFFFCERQLITVLFLICNSYMC